MPTIREEPVEFKSDGADSRHGHLHITDYNQSDRGKRAAKALAICWGLSVASLPIIFAHWVLVPGFFLAGPFMAYRYYHIHSVPKDLSGQCPLCQQEVTIGLEANDQLPMWTYCPSCNKSIHVIDQVGATT